MTYTVNKFAPVSEFRKFLQLEPRFAVPADDIRQTAESSVAELSANEVSW